jgi:hypothetical protein
MKTTFLEQKLAGMLIAIDLIIEELQSCNKNIVNDKCLLDKIKRPYQEHGKLEILELLKDLEHIFNTSKHIIKFMLININKPSIHNNNSNFSSVEE